MKQLAPINIARLKHPRNDPRVADFFADLDRINSAAERMPGFVWRLNGESGDATGMPWPDDPDMTVYLTVWENIALLEKFVWQTMQTKVYARKHDWFEKPATPNLAMWWIEPGAFPTLEEAKGRLDHLTLNGPSEFAFGWESVPEATLWREARCA